MSVQTYRMERAALSGSSATTRIRTLAVIRTDETNLSTHCLRRFFVVCRLANS